MCNSMNPADDCGCCRNELNLEKLCVCCIKGKCAKIKKIVSNDICSQAIEVKNLMAENETVNNLCAINATLNTACIDTLTVGQLNHCAKYRAAVTVSAPISYALGSNIDWDVILDDPNGNVAVGPFSYTVPVSGYYVMNFYLNSDTLFGSSVISGVPVGLLNVTSNALPFRQFNAPYLSFSNQQFSSLSALVILNAGDVVRMKYDVIVLDPTLGQINYVGSISLRGNGAVPNSSGFEIHYLSSLNCSPVTCVKCVQVTTLCVPIDCNSNPCDSCK